MARKTIGYATAVGLIFPSAAPAAEVCVKCTAPDANYSCVVGASGLPDTVLKLYCITALAKAGPHASCAIDRATTAPCQGARKELPAPAALNDGMDVSPQSDVTPAGSAPSREENPTASPSTPNPAAAAAGQPAETLKETPPKTVQEMVEKSAKSAGDGLSETQKSASEAAKTASTALEQAGSAVTNAAKSSWRCLSSLFSKCGQSE